MDNKGPKNLLPEEEYLKQMRALPKVKAAEDFLRKVHERIERRSAFEKIMRALFVPVKVKVPLELAAMAAAIFLIVSTVGIKKSAEQLAFAPKAKMATGTGIIMKNELYDRDSYSGKRVAEAENRPVEIALLIGSEKPLSSMDEKQRSDTVDRVEVEKEEALSLEKKAFRLEEKAKSAVLKPYLPGAVSKVRGLVESAGGKITAVENDKDSGLPQYLDAEIPAAGYAKFAEKLSSIGVIQEPILKEAPRGRETVQVRIKFTEK